MDKLQQLLQSIKNIKTDDQPTDIVTKIKDRQLEEQSLWHDDLQWCAINYYDDLSPQDRWDLLTGLAQYKRIRQLDPELYQRCDLIIEKGRRLEYIRSCQLTMGE